MGQTPSVLRVVPPAAQDEFPEFWTWLRARTHMGSKTVQSAAVLAVALAVLNQITDILKNLSVRLQLPSLGDPAEIVHGTQIAVVFLMLVVLTRVRLAHDKRFVIGTAGQRQLRRWWALALLSFLGLYMVLWFRVPFESAPTFTWNRVLGTLANLCNNLSTYAFLMCFATMEHPEDRGEATKNSWALLWVACLVLVTFVEAAVKFKSRAVADTWAIDWFALFTAINAGIALGMFCGRLASPLIDPGLSVMAPLYSYAAVQVSYPFWTSHKHIETLMAGLALVLKCLLFAVVTWLLTTKHLIFYMEQLHEVRSQLGTSRNRFRSPVSAQPAPPKQAATAK